MSTAKDPFVEVAAGAAVFKEGDSGGDMFIIESGQVDIVRKARGDEPIATLGPGDFFGEMAILEDQPRFAGAIARTSVRLLRIERSAFADVLKQNVEIGVRIMRKLAARHRRAEQRAQDALTELAQLKSAAASAPRARDAAKPKAEAPAPAARAAPEAPAPVAAAPAPVPAPPAPAPAAPVAVAQNLALRIVASGQVLLLEPERSEFLVGRPDPVTGIQPEINLGPFDTMRTLSRRHAKILKEGGLYFVREEVGTTNGTFVNGERIKTGAAVPLKPGNRLRFGSIEVEVVAQ
ncbi:MAG TPA: cyclic nucleotide-binding domain-containing protein [Rudaea sp.]|nr:cyclic nucleotide-binding domain-containing protein [Rudaea sp.]